MLDDHAIRDVLDLWCYNSLRNAYLPINVLAVKAVGEVEGSRCDDDDPAQVSCFVVEMHNFIKCEAQRSYRNHHTSLFHVTRSRRSNNLNSSILDS